jgi:arylsulfatase A-like enzyme
MVNEGAGMAARSVILVLLAVAGVVTALEAWNSVTHYRTPYTFRQDLPGGPPLTERVALIILDGVRLDASQGMKNLQELARRGASGTVRTGVPSLSHPSRAVIVTGSWQEVNGVTNNSRFEPPPVDSLFSLANRMAVPAAVAGSYFWSDAFGQHLDSRRARLHGQKLPFGTPPQELIAWHEPTCREDLDFLARQQEGLLVVGITAADAAAHDFGGRSEQYLQVAGAVDECVGSFVKALGDGRTTLIVTSDHGHIDLRGHGGHGGLEEEVLTVPLVLAGKAVRSGSGWQASQVDIAPTICALLGLPFPATNQGSVLWQQLDIPQGIEPALRSREAEQRAVAAANFPDFEQVRGDERRARSLRALAMFTSIWFLACAMVLSYRDDWKALLIAVALYYAVYYALFFAFGMRYSLSVINRQEYMPWFFGKDLAAAAIAFCVAGVFLVRRLKAPGGFLLLDFGLLAACSLGIQVAWAYFDAGLFMEAVMPGLQSSFKACLDLVQLAAIGIAAPGLALLYTLTSRRRERSAVRSDPKPTEAAEQVAAAD